MFYKKTSNNFKTKNLQISIDDFSKGLNFSVSENILNPNYSVNSYNFSFNKGALTESYGFKALTAPESNSNDTTFLVPVMPLEKDDLQLVDTWYFKFFHPTYNQRRDKLIVLGIDNQIYFMNLIEEYPSIDGYNLYTLSERPTCIMNYKINDADYNVICSESDGIIIWDGINTPQKMTSAPKASSICVHDGRIFCTVDGDRSYIRYTSGDQLNIQGFMASAADENGGKIVFGDNSKVNKVLSFMGYLYAFKDFGIAKITTYKDSVDFDIKNLSNSGNKIYEKTICICGDKIFMLTKDGITSFNGVSSELLNIEVNKLFDGVINPYAIACFHSGKYYLACRLNFQDGETVGCEALSGVTIKNNAVIVIDVETLKYEVVRGVDLSSLTSIQYETMDKIVICSNNWKVNQLIEFDRSGKFYNNVLKKVWNSPLTDLGYSDKVKLVKSFSVLSYYDCKITIYTENKEKTYNVVGKKTMNKIRVNLKGKQVGIKIESVSEKAYISNLKLDIDLLDYAYSVL